MPLRCTGTCLLALGLVAACAADSTDPSEPLTYFGFEESSYSAAAREGMAEIFAGRCFHGGIPIRVMTAMAANQSNPASKSSSSSDRTPRNEARVNMPSPPNRPKGLLPNLPLGASVFRRNGVVLLNGNCFGCHAGVVHGQVVAGLGNNLTDQVAEFEGAKLLLDPTEKWVASLKSDAEKKEFLEFVTHARASLTPFQYARTRGDNFGPYAVWRLGARFADPEKTGMLVSEDKTKLEELLESIELPTVDPMPWWLMKYKKKDYWYSDGGIDDAAHFAVNFTTAHPEVNETRAEHIESVAKALAFARETKSPPFPKPLNAQRVQMGADLFHGRTRPMDSTGFTACKNCHGTYTKTSSLDQPGSWDVSYTNSTLLKNVKTDPAYNETLQKLKPIAEHIMKLKTYFTAKGTPELAPIVTVPNKSGYVPPPLVGIWASAPYFHNGSVPTIEAVLNSKERPEIWSRNTIDPRAYNWEQVGLDFKVVSREELASIDPQLANAQSASEASLVRRSIYDTRGFGRANTGHTFGDRLTQEERSAVIEFLKSLSGPGM